MTVWRMREKKYRISTSVDVVMVGTFWYSEGILLVDFLKRDATINSERYMQTLKKLIQ